MDKILADINKMRERATENAGETGCAECYDDNGGFYDAGYLDAIVDVLEYLKKHQND